MLIFLFGGKKMADKKFNIVFDVDANIGPVKNAVSNLQSALSKINVPDSFKKGLTDTFTKLDNEIKNFESIASKGFTNLADVNKAEKSFDKVTDLLSKLRTEAARLKGVDPNKLLPKETIDKTKALHSEWIKLKAAIDKGFGNTAEITKQTAALDKQREAVEKLENEQNKLQELRAGKEESKKSIAGNLAQATAEAEKLQKAMRQIELHGETRNNTNYTQKKQRLAELNKEISNYNSQLRRADEEIGKFDDKLKANSIDLEQNKNKVTDLETQLDALKSAAQQTPEGLNQLREKLAEIKGVNLNEIPTDIDAIGREIQDLNVDQVQQLTQSIDGLEPPLKEATNATQGLGNAMNAASDQMHEMTAREKEIEQLANRVKYFFSIGNTVMLFRRAIKSAINTVKELDEVMTQAAVVTKFDVSGMWAQLPEYTKRANELGVTIKGVYEASTLYYQQGLETEQVIGVTNETLKMAKIAGLDYATATNYMTSALRGFNMEVNELSAQKVNDIYSQLAAKTASNVEEISIAMSKVAPLAHNAGMEIETTAAMLAQMIEKTREAPETLGTAMKTVIARFQELKKDPALIEPIDGEIVDANKVETALNTIGVALRDTSGQFRQLDDVFLEISQKWDSLDVNTQRYIATIAAGSRQQSRFIAMMADYARTTNLVNLANNAAGASAEQFEKTQASLATALNRLKNAWDQFTMGLANNQIIKITINLISSFINTVNKLTNTLSAGSGLLKSFFNLGTLLIAIKLGRAAFTGFFNWLLKNSVVRGTAAGTATGQGFGAGLNKTLVSVQKLFTKTAWVNPGTTAQIKALQQAQASLNLEYNKEEINLNTLTAARTRYNAAMAAYANQLVLTNSQQEIANLLMAAGADETDAKILATSGLTKTEAEEFIVSQAQLGGEEAEIKARMKNAAAIKAEDTIEKGHIQTQQMGILTRARYILQLLFGTKAARADAIAKLGLAKADATATKSQWSLNAAMAACPIGYIIAGIAAITTALIVLSNISKKQTLEYKMQKAAEETKKAEEAVDKAKEGYDKLLENKNEYSELQQTLEDLTYGTQEWKQALVDVNQEVLKLIKTYPELAKYVEKGSYGQLTISQAGWDDLINSQQQAIINTQNWATTSSLYEGILRERSLEEDLNRKFTYMHQGSGEDILDTAAKDAIRKAIEAGWTDFSKEGLKELGIESELSSEQLSKAAQAMREYDEAVKENRYQMQKTAEVFLQNTLNPDTAEQLGINNTENIINAFSGAMIRASENPKYKVKDIWVKDNLSEWKTNEIFQNLVKDYKLEGKMSGNDLHDLQVLYAEMAGENLTEVQENMKDKKELANAIAKMANNKDLQKNMDEFANGFLTLGKEAQKEINLAMSEGAAILAGGNIKLNEEGKLSQEVENNLKTLYHENESVYGLVYETEQDFVDAYTEAIKNGNEELDKSRNKLRAIRLKIDDETFAQNLDSGAVKGLTNHLLEIFEASGIQATQEMADNISSITAGMDTNTAAKFATILNGLDWKNADNIEQLSDRIKEMGLDVGLTDTQIDGLEQQIISLAKAARTVDLEKLEKQIRGLGQIAYDIGSGKQGRGFSEETKNTLVEAGVAKESDFVFNFETGEFTYLGGSMDSLRVAIIENTKALTGETKKQLDKDIAAAEMAKQILDNNDNAKNSFDEYVSFLYSEGIGGPEFVKMYNDALMSGQYKLTNGELARAFIESGQSDKNLDWLKTATETQIIDFVNSMRQQVNSLSDLEDKKTALEQDEAVQDYITQYQGETNVLVYKVNSGDSTASDALKLMAINAGVAEEAINSLNNAQLASVIQSTQLANGYKIETEELNDYAKALLKTTNAEVKLTDKAYRFALANKRLEKGFNDLKDNYEDWYNILKEGENNEAFKGSDKYLQASQDYRTAVQNLIDAKTELSEKWVEKNLDNLSKAGAGDQKAFEEIIISAIIDTSGIEESTPEINAAIAEVLNDPALQDMKIGAEIDIDTNPAINSLYNLLVQAGISAGQIQSMFNELGWEMEPIIEEVYYPEIDQTMSTLTGFRSITKKTPSPLSYGSFMNKGSGSGGGGSEKEPEWENPYDKLYNITKQINGELRIREQLEKRYQRLLNTHVETGKLLKENIDQQIASLEKQNKLQEEIRDGRLEQIKELEAENSDLLQYARFDETVGVGGEIQINWDLINDVDKANNEELGKRIENYISKMEEWTDSRHEAIDAIEDNTDAIIELQQIGKEEYKDLEDRALEAIIGHQQRLIDEQEKINDSINEANEALTDAISKNIEKIRQDRQNQETETSLAEKERRLAYLRQDTTGSNAVEIKKLEKDLEKERQNYTDSLIDQSLNDLKEQNDAAAKQREKQIELMQSQLVYQEKTGYFADQATDLVKKAMTGGFVDVGSDLYKLLEENEDYYEKTNASRKEWFEDLQASIAKAYVYSQNTDSGNIMETMISAAQNGDLGIFRELENQRNAKIRSQGLQDQWPETDMYESYREGRYTEGAIDKNTDYMQGLLNAANSGDWTKAFKYAGLRDKKIADYGITGYDPAESFWTAFEMWRKAGQQWNRYASGGLADYTGPAWLDGTKSRPEMVLNARDTQNFLELRDILSSMAASGTGNSSVGNFYCDIDINVGEISNDYDVDRIAARIKQSIYEDSTYRNVNAINFLK